MPARARSEEAIGFVRELTLRSQMTKTVFTALVLLCYPVLAQERFDIKDASRDYDVRVEVAKCAGDICDGKVTFTLFKKSKSKPFQIFTLADTSFLLDSKKSPPANKTLLYDEQSALNFGDFNFDGMQDLALCDGKRGGYGMPSYQVYLFSQTANKFIFSPSLSKLVHGVNLGMFEVDAKRRVLTTYSKSGCCFHETDEFSVVNDHPRKILEITEDASIPDEKRVKVITKRLVNGRWRTTIKYLPRTEQ